MLWQCQHRLAALKLAAATHIRPRFASLQRDIHDFPLGIGRMRLHKGFVPRDREVAIHLDIAIKLSGQAATARAEDADAAHAVTANAGAALAPAEDADDSLAAAVDAVGTCAMAENAVASVGVSADGG